MLLQAWAQPLGRGGAEMREAPVVGLAAVGEFAQAPVGLARMPEAAELRLAAESPLLVPGARLGIEPAEIAVLQRLERPLHGTGEAVALAAPIRLEESRGTEIRDQDAVDHVAELDILAGIGDLQKKRDLALVLQGRGPPDLPAAAGVDEHGEAFMARGERPGGPGLDQAIGAAMPVQMHAGRARLGNLVRDDDRPVADRNLAQAGKGRNAGLHPPERCEVTRNLTLKRGPGSDDLAQRDLLGRRDKSDLTQHPSFLPAASCRESFKGKRIPFNQG